ncbi:MAG: hypothetical protein ACE5I3_11415 [Phycisphaerae bacterium]
MLLRHKLGLFLVLIVGGTGFARAHVILDVPNGGEVLEVGSTFTITWHVQIQHNTQNWDLWYSATGPNGPWLEIAMDLPVGDPSGGSVHTYDWTLPNTVTDQARVRVRMDNSATDYYDISNADFSIVPAPGDCPEDLDGNGSVGLEDLAQLLAAYGSCAGDPGFDSAADLDGDGCVGLLDLASLLAFYGTDCP